MSRFRCLFSYYGAKGKIAHKYPAPRHETIIEPFAGGACYSLLYCDQPVILNELCPITHSMWQYFLNTDIDQILTEFPASVRAGNRISEMVDTQTADAGLVALLRSAANMGTAGCRATWNVVTELAAVQWDRSRQRFAYWWPKTRHWRLINGNFSALENRTATWFVDPPYNNKAGAKYRQCAIDYQSLGSWCRSRTGQVIACENVGATWLPFRNLCAVPPSFHARPKSEAIWERVEHPLPVK